MKNLLLTTAFIFTLPVAATAQELVGHAEVPPGAYSLDKGHASITWKVSHLGLSDYTARFTDFDADLDFNSEDPTQSSLNVTINPLSVTTDYYKSDEKDFDKKLAENKDWFNGLEFPEITFASTDITMSDETSGTVTGDLTMLGVTKPVTLNVDFNGAYTNKPFVGIPALGFSASTSLMRSEWGMGTYVPNIGDQVDVMIEVEFHKDQAPEQAVE